MDAGFLEALVKAGSMILVSEIGDKTFFVAALLAMRQPRRWVLLGSLCALWLMTIISSLFGWAAPNLLPRAWTHVSTTLLFFLFGLRSLWDGLTMDAARVSEELKEVEQELDKATIAAATASAPPSTTAPPSQHKVMISYPVNRVFSPHVLPSSSSRAPRPMFLTLSLCAPIPYSPASIPTLPPASLLSRQHPYSPASIPTHLISATPTSPSLSIQQPYYPRLAAHTTTPLLSLSDNGVNGGGHEGSMNGVGAQGEEESKQRKAQRLAWHRFFSPAFLQAFSLVFLGEWGDKSQLATIGLASEASVWGVALGGCIGHAVCSGAAVMGGRHLASRISERTVALCAGVLFLLFGVQALLHGSMAA
ncbi:unnamed protein product [Closterium sp. Naga37s-1]|nr:unnamed protein product [Closterium sp. Naga37s-1]